MIHIFYTIGLILAIYHLFLAFGAQSLSDDNEELKKLSEENEKTAPNIMSFEYKWLAMKVLFIIVCVIIWLFFGVFTEQWLVFILYFILTMVSSKIIKLIGGENVKDTWFYKSIYLPTWHLFNAALFTFLVVNFYHLHIDIPKLILQYIGF